MTGSGSVTRELGVLAAAAAFTVLGVTLGLFAGGLPEGPSPVGSYLVLADNVVLRGWPVLLFWLMAATVGRPLAHLLAIAPADRRWLAPALGAGGLLLVGWLVAHIATPTPRVATIVLATGAIGAVVGLRPWAMGRRRRRWLTWPWATFGLPAGLLAATAAVAPGLLWAVEAFGYDVLSYHLQLPREWMAAGAVSPLNHNAYSYLPSLAEIGYLWVTAPLGGPDHAPITAQLMHASFALLAAGIIGRLALKRTGRPMAVVGGILVFTVPWVIITGSLAYNEMVVLALGAAGWSLVLTRPLSAPGSRWRLVAAGVLCGLAIMAKLTAGPLILLPLLALLATGTRQKPAPAGHRAIAAAIIALAAALVLTPWMARNAARTANPVFPMATTVLPTGHWNEQQAQRWQNAHRPTTSTTERARRLARRWVLSPGYGAVGGQPKTQTSTDVGHLGRGPGVPLVLLAALAGGVVLLASRQQRLAAGLVLALGVQVAAWWLLTHHQGRFLVPTLLPLALMTALGAGVASARLPRSIRPLLGAGLVGLLLMVALLSGRLIDEQARSAPIDGQRTTLRPWRLINSWAPPGTNPRGAVAGIHPADRLADVTRLYVVADNGGLLAIDPPVTYHTPFDPSPLGQWLSETDATSASITRRLRETGHSHVWVGWSELKRLRASYGYHPAVTQETLRKIAREARWRPVYRQPFATLYALPE